MKFVHPSINQVFDTTGEWVNVIIIENPELFTEIVGDLYYQTQGMNGDSSVSEDNKELDMTKYVEILSQFVPFEINQKNLLTKLTSALEQEALHGELAVRTSELLCNIEKYLLDVSFGINCNIEFNKLSIGSLLKASGVSICDDYTCLAEKILDYFELVGELDRKKLFVTVNLRSYMDDSQVDMFLESVIMHEYQVIMIENCEKKKSIYEKRYIIDDSLCEMC